MYICPHDLMTLDEDGSADPHGPHVDAVLDEIADHSTLFTKGAHNCDMSQLVEG